MKVLDEEPQTGAVAAFHSYHVVLLHITTHWRCELTRDCRGSLQTEHQSLSAPAHGCADSTDTLFSDGASVAELYRAVSGEQPDFPTIIYK